jgi:hypothetical protein
LAHFEILNLKKWPEGNKEDLRYGEESIEKKYAQDFVWGVYHELQMDSKNTLLDKERKNLSPTSFIRCIAENTVLYSIIRCGCGLML